MSAPWSRTKASRRVLTPDEAWAASIARRILADCHPWQRDAVIDPARRLSYLVGRGGAKTTSMRARAIIKIIALKGQTVGYAATSADQARILNWEKIKDTCEAYGIRSQTTNIVSKDPDVTFLDAKMVLRCLRTGSIYQLRGVEDRRDAEKFRGYGQAEFQVDECGSFPPQLLDYLANTCVAPRLGEGLALPAGWLEFLAGDGEIEDAPPLVEARGGCMTLGSTPPQLMAGEFYDVTRDGSPRHRPYRDRDKLDAAGHPVYPNWRGYSSHFWTLEDVYELENSRQLYPALVANWEEALVEKAEKGWSDDNPIWLREYKGQWSADNTSTIFRYRPHVDGKAWNEWDPFNGQPLEGAVSLRAAIDALPLDDSGKAMTWQYVYAADAGTRDPFALNIYAFSPQDRYRRVFHVFAFERVGVLYARLFAQMLLGVDESAPNGCCPHERATGLLGMTGWPVGSVIDTDQAYIDELANVYGIRFAKAEKNPNYKFGAIELVNGDLVEGFIKIIKGSPLAKQLGTLQWKPDDFGNPREDKSQANHCFVAGTMVATEHGERPIESVAVGTRVWTRNGLRRVTWSGCSGTQPTWHVELSSGRSLTATADHKIWTGRGWIPLELLTRRDTLVAWESTGQASASRFRASNTAGTPSPRTPLLLGTSGPAKGSPCTERNGRPFVAIFPPDATSITKMETAPTTGSPISPSSTGGNTSALTASSPSVQPYPAPHCSSTPSPPQPDGTDRQPAGHGTARTRERQNESPSTISPVSCAAIGSFPRTFTPSCAARSATPRSDEIAGSMTSPQRACSAAGNSDTADFTPNASALRIVSRPVATGRSEPVYDLSVEQDHEFFANGALVSNSTDTLIYGRRLIATLFESGAVIHEAKAKPHAPDPMGLDEPEVSPRGEFSDVVGADNFDEIWGG